MMNTMVKTIFTLQHSALIILTIIGLFVRSIGEPDIPQGFYQDEAGIVYSAYSVLKTGKDEWNRSLPLHFKALGDYPPGIYNYLTALAIPVVGFNELAERLPSILFGTLLIPLTYFLIHTFSKNQKFSLLIAFLVTFSPWDIVQSRSGSEPIVALCFIYTAWIMYKMWTRKPLKRYLFLIAFLYFLSIFTYNSVKLVLPLLHSLLVWFTFKQTIHKKIALISIPFVFLIAYSSVFAIKGADIPYQNSFVMLKDYSNENQAYYFREGTKNLPVLLSRIFHNKITSIALSTLGRYWTYLSGNVLFFQGGLPGRYIVPGVGVILSVLSPFFVVGLIQHTYLHDRQKLFLIIWVLLGLLPGVLFIDFFPHIKRIMFAYLPLYIFIGSGLVYCYHLFSNRAFKSAFLICFGSVFFWNFGYVANQYYIHSQYETVLYRSYGWGEVLHSAKRLESEYEAVHVYLHNEDAVVFYLFYNQIDPRKIQSVADTRPTSVFMSDSKRIAWSFNNYVFNPFPCPNTSDLQVGRLYLTVAECINPTSIALPPGSVTVRHTTFMPDGAPRFVLFERAKKIATHD